MLNTIKETIKKHSLLSENENVVVGFSGGADSALLTYALKNLNFNVTAVHIHHGIRGTEADRDLFFAQSFCEKYNIPFYSERIDVPAIASERKISIETAARQERYKIFEEYAKRFSAKIAVAHNKNDQAETVLMHLLRGSGLNGLCGIQYKNNNIIRPLLDVTRKEIEDFTKNNSIEYIVDSTNLCTEYSRNKIRLDVLPKLDEISGTDSVDAIVQCSRIINEYADYFNEEVDNAEKKFISKKDDKISLSITPLPHILQIELIKSSLIRLIGNIVDIEKVHLDDIYGLIKKNSGKEIHLPHNIRVKRVYDSLLFYKEENFFSAEYSFEPNKVFNWKKDRIYSEKTSEIVPQKDCEYIDIDMLPKGLVLRTRHEGDYIYPLNSGGKCTLKKYFIDKKIPSDVRNELPLLAFDNEIFAIIGYTVSDKAKITPSTKNILKIFREK